MGCTRVACDLIQSFCCLLLKFPWQDPLARIEERATYRPLVLLPRCWRSSCKKALPPAHDFVEIATTRPHDLALPDGIVGILQGGFLRERWFFPVQNRLIQDCQFRIEYLRSQSI